MSHILEVFGLGQEIEDMEGEDGAIIRTDGLPQYAAGTEMAVAKKGADRHFREVLKSLSAEDVSVYR